MANGCQIQTQRTKLPLEAQKAEKWHMTSSKVIDLWWPRLTSERSQCQCKPWMSPPNTYPCPCHQQTYRSSQVSRRWNGTERKFRLTWLWKSGHRSKVMVGTYLKFSGKVYNCTMVWYTKFCDDRPIRSRVILGKPEGGLHHPPPLLCRRGLKTKIPGAMNMSAYEVDIKYWDIEVLFSFRLWCLRINQRKLNHNMK